MSALRSRADAAAQVLVDGLDDPQLGDADSHHLGRVLRLRDGEQVVAFDGSGGWRLCTYRGSVLESASDVVHEPAEPDPVRVYLPALKQDRAEWAVTKLTELGVDEIGLVTCDRSAVRANAEARGRILARWSRVAREAACQSRRVRLPVILDATDVAGAMAAGATMCELDGDDLGDTVRTVVVGPEGGWSDAELALGAPGVSLGETVLRAETAAVAGGVLLAAARRAARHAGGSEAQ